MKLKRLAGIISVVLLTTMLCGCACSLPIISQMSTLESDYDDDNDKKEETTTNETEENEEDETENTKNPFDYRVGLKGGPVESWEIIGSWYGKYREPHFTSSGVYQESFEADMNFSIEDCDEEGNFYGEGYTISVTEGDEYEGNWLRFSITGKVDLNTGKFKIEQVERLGGTYGLNISHEIYSGVIEGDNMEGVITNETYELGEELTFSFGRVSKWAKDEITEANARGLIPPTLQGKDLSEKITRAEFAAVALELYESLTDSEAFFASSPFVDIAGNENEDSIEKAYMLNIVNGVSDTNFEPNESISRQDLATMLCRALKKYLFNDWTIDTDSQYPLDYSDVNYYADHDLISEYARPSVYYLTKLEVISGIDDYHFAPQNTTSEEEAMGYATATREQAIALSLRIFKISGSLKR